MILHLFVFLITGGSAFSCEDYPECNTDEFKTQNPGVNCGVRISNDTRTGPKCIYLLKARQKEPQSRLDCANLVLRKEGQDEIKTGNLVTLNNAAENNMTGEYINLFGQPDGTTTVYFAYAFIGLRKNCRHCSFSWADNEPVTYTNYYGNEPNTVSYECTQIRTTGTYAMQWIDMSCSSSYPAVCQFFPSGENPIPKKPVLPQKGGCKQGWWKYGGYCYKDFGFSEDINDKSGHEKYGDGNSSCYQGTSGDWPGSRMAIMPTIQHNNLVASLLGPGRYQDDVWIGIYNHAYYDYYFSLDNYDKLTYDNWAPGYPNHLHGNIDKCAKMSWKSETKLQGTAKLGQWTNQHCTLNKHPYICSHEQDPALANAYSYPQTFALDKVKCEKGWIPYHTACYKLFTDPMTFDQANDKCDQEKSRGAVRGSLATGWDEYETLFIESFLYDDDNLPTGYPSDLPNGFWIGLKYRETNEKGKRWSWIDNWPTAYTRWYGEEPTGLSDCGFTRSEGYWGTDDCNFQRPFVCKSEFYDYVPDPSSNKDKRGALLPCDDGWEDHNGHCVRVVVEPKLNWFNADKDCKERGGALASIHSENYNTYLTGLFLSKTANKPSEDWEGFWIGGSSTGVNWEWSDGTTITYFNWAQGEPNNFENNNEDCIEVWKNGRWNDDDCEEKVLPYICKKVRKTENCEAAVVSGKQKRCGEADTNEYACMEFGCCWDLSIDTGDGSHCFKPNPPIDVGMAAGAAVAVTLVVIGIAAGGYFYYTKFGFGAITGSFSNPTQA